jgi:carboxymethylenebutenolidase
LRQDQSASPFERKSEIAMIELISEDGHRFSAYRAEPPGEPKGAVVVLQDLSGVSAHIQKEVDGFAAQGYVAIAPALFDREKKSVDFGFDEHGLNEGEKIAKSVPAEAALRDIQAAVDSVKGAGKVALVGYSWGGYLAYLSANSLRDVACAIGYSASELSQERPTKRKIPTLLHFPENDPTFPIEDIMQFRASRPDISAFSYPKAGHDFNFDAATTFNAEAAQAARERTLSWISQFVVGQPPVALKNSGSYAQAKTDKKKKKSGGDDMGPPLN